MYSGRKDNWSPTSPSAENPKSNVPSPHRPLRLRHRIRLLDQIGKVRSDVFAGMFQFLCRTAIGVGMQHVEDGFGVAAIQVAEDFADAEGVFGLVEGQDALGERKLAFGALVLFE